MRPRWSWPCVLNPHHKRGVGLHGRKHNIPPFPPPTPQEAGSRVLVSPQQVTQGALVRIKEGDVEFFQSRPVWKVGGRAYLVAENYLGHANCTLSRKGRTQKMATKNLFFLYIWKTYHADTMEKMVFHAIRSPFYHFVCWNKILFCLIGRVSSVKVIASVFLNPASTGHLKSSISKKGFCVTPVVTKFVQRNKLLLCP